jgi:hypothetical protein
MLENLWAAGRSSSVAHFSTSTSSRSVLSSSCLLCSKMRCRVLPGDRAAAQAAVDTHVPITAGASNPCTGEAFVGSGFIHVKIFESFDPNYHVSMEENVESFQATTPSGVRYVVPEQIASHTIADTDAVPVNSTVEEIGQAIRQGEDGALVTGDDFYIRFSSHYTYNGNGDLTASFSDFTTDCR